MNKINAATLALIESFEGFVNHWYADPALGWKVPTCCFGHTDAAGEPKYAEDKARKFTRAEGETILANDLASTAAAVSKAVKVKITDNQFGALVSFTFNVGTGNLLKSTLLRKLNTGDAAGAAKEFAKWNKAAGKSMTGLTKRRAAEAKLFSTP